MFTAIIDTIIHISNHWKDSFRVEISFNNFDTWTTYKLK